MNIEKIIHTADWHHEPYLNHDKFDAGISKFISSIEDEVGSIDPEKVRIIIAGDLFDNKNKDPSNVSFIKMAKVLKELSDKYKTHVFIGNHDYDINNPQTCDCITPIIDIFKLFGNDNIQFHKHSGCFVDKNILFCNYSNYDNNKRPDIEKYVEKYPNKTVVGVFHDVVVGAVNHSSYDISQNHHNVTNAEVFCGCDFTIMGDIHKHQVIKYNGGKNQAVYSGSLYQLNYGESVTGHGYCLWDVETKSFQFKEIDIEYGLYKIILETDSILSTNYNLENLFTNI